jgi:hypothetical protein
MAEIDIFIKDLTENLYKNIEELIKENILTKIKEDRILYYKNAF